MQSFWVAFTDGSKACCQGESQYDAKVIAEKVTGKKVAGGEYRDIAAERLPYPASPAVWLFDHPAHGKMPKFCTTPNQCKGRTACPKSYACSE